MPDDTAPDPILEEILALGRELRAHAERDEKDECLRLLGVMTTRIRDGAMNNVRIVAEFYEAMRIVGRWFPQVWPGALEIARALHTRRPDAETATWFIETLRMNGEHETAHDIAYESVQRFTITPGLLLEAAAAYTLAGHPEAARQFLAAGVQNGIPVNALIEQQPTLACLRQFL